MLPFLDELDSEQYDAATSNLNVTVSAGAGSGKTRVLAARYLWLITQGICRVEEILTITFTNKAANEMYDRIYRLLLAHRAIPQARLAVDNFHNASICTLDSFCAQVARSSSRLYGVSPDFSPNMAGLREQARDLALRFVLDNRNNPGLKELIAEKKIRLVADELFAFPALEYSQISRPIPYSDITKRQKEKLIHDWNEKTRRVSDGIAALKQKARECDTEFAGDFDAALAFSVRVPDIDCFLRGQGNDGEKRNADEYFSFLHRIASFNVRKRSEKYAAFREGRDELKDSLANLEAIAGYVLRWDIVEAVYPLMEEYQDILNRKKRSSGMLGFSDIACLAVDALKRDVDLRQMYKKTFRKIMIDEFQDNNSLQRDLVYLLAEKHERRETTIPEREDLLPDKVFFVGDEKQSIYSFRGADVSVFRGLTEDFSRAGENLKLQCNYRSVPMLIKAFNRIFGGLCGGEDVLPEASGETSLPEAAAGQEEAGGAGRDSFSEWGIFPPKGKEGAAYEASYSRLRSRETSEKDAEEPALHFAFFDKGRINEDDPHGAEAHEAAFIAWKIRDMVTRKHEIYDRKEKKKRPCTYSDFAVLQRSYTRQHELEKQLKSYGVPFRADKPAGLFSDAPVNDLSALLRLLVYPFDRIAYAALLRSPLVRLSDAAFTVCQLNAAAPGREPFDPETESLIPEQDRELYRRGGRLYREFREDMGKLSVSELVTKLWYSEGYRYETLWSPSAQAFSDLYDLFFELARFIDSSGKGLPEFLDYLEALVSKKENIDDAELPEEAGNGVRLMSIHKCKGLEFPVVFVCNCAKTEKSRPQTTLASYSQRWGVSLKLPPAGEKSAKSGNYFYLLEKEEENRKRTAELRRLLYVAMTRAECVLYVTSSLPAQKDSEKQAEVSQADTMPSIQKRLSALCDSSLKPNSFLNLLIPILTGRETQSFTLEPILNRIEKESDEEKNSLRKAAAGAAGFYEKTPVPESEAPYAAVIPASELHLPYSPPRQFSGETGDEAGIDRLLETAGLGSEVFGTIVHGFIEARFKNLPQKIPSRILAGIRENQAESINEKARELADTFFTSPLGLKSAASAFREIEFPILTAAGDSIVSGKIDLLFEQEDELYIVDFKTDKNVEPLKHAGQLALYRRAVLDIYGKPVRCWLFFVRCGRAVELDDTAFETSVEDLVTAWKTENLHRGG